MNELITRIESGEVGPDVDFAFAQALGLTESYRRWAFRGARHAYVASGNILLTVPRIDDFNAIFRAVHLTYPSHAIQLRSRDDAAPVVELTTFYPGYAVYAGTGPTPGHALAAALLKSKEPR